jgi:hypothetical protein
MQIFDHRMKDSDGNNFFYASTHSIHERCLAVPTVQGWREGKASQKARYISIAQYSSHVGWFGRKRRSVRTHEVEHRLPIGHQIILDVAAGTAQGAEIFWVSK